MHDVNVRPDASAITQMHLVQELICIEFKKIPVKVGPLRSSAQETRREEKKRLSVFYTLALRESLFSSRVDDYLAIALRLRVVLKMTRWLISLMR